MTPDLPDYVSINRESWTRANAEYTDARARDAWVQAEIRWGLWQTPERELKALPDVAGKDVHVRRLGPTLARRGDLAGAQASLTVSGPCGCGQGLVCRRSHSSRRRPE
jgi:hypothetical protein